MVEDFLNEEVRQGTENPKVQKVQYKACWNNCCLHLRMLIGFQIFGCSSLSINTGVTSYMSTGLSHTSSAFASLSLVVQPTLQSRILSLSFLVPPFKPFKVSLGFQQAILPQLLSNLELLTSLYIGKQGFSYASCDSNFNLHVDRKSWWHFNFQEQFWSLKSYLHPVDLFSLNRLPKLWRCQRFY